MLTEGHVDVPLDIGSCRLWNPCELETVAWSVAGRKKAFEMFSTERFEAYCCAFERDGGKWGEHGRKLTQSPRSVRLSRIEVCQAFGRAPSFDHKNRLWRFVGPDVLQHNEV